MKVGRMEANHTNDQQQFYFQHPGHTNAIPSGSIIYPGAVGVASSSGNILNVVPTSMLSTGGGQLQQAVFIGSGSQSLQQHVTALPNHTSVAPNSMTMPGLGGLVSFSPGITTSMGQQVQLLQSSPSTNNPIAKKRRPKKTSPVASNSSSPKAVQVQLLNSNDMTAAPTELTLLVQQAMYPANYTPPPPPSLVTTTPSSSNVGTSVIGGGRASPRGKMTTVSLSSLQQSIGASSQCSTVSYSNSSVTSQGNFGMAQPTPLVSATTVELPRLPSINKNSYVFQPPGGLVVSSPLLQSSVSETVPTSSSVQTSWTMPSSVSLTNTFLNRSNSAIESTFIQSTTRTVSSTENTQSGGLIKSTGYATPITSNYNNDFSSSFAPSTPQISHVPNPQSCSQGFPLESRSDESFTFQDSEFSHSNAIFDIQCDDNSKDVSLPHTPSSNLTAPSPQPNKQKMDMDKLDDTIDHVMELVHSDEKHEDIFVLPPRCREALMKTPDIDTNERPPSQSQEYSSPAQQILESPVKFNQSSSVIDSKNCPYPSPQHQQVNFTPMSSQPQTIPMTNFIVDKVTSQGQTIIAAVPNQRSVMTTNLQQLPSGSAIQCTPPKNLQPTVYIQHQQQRINSDNMLVQGQLQQGQQVLVRHQQIHPGKSPHHIYIPSSAGLIEQQHVPQGHIIAQRQLFTLTQNNQIQAPRFMSPLPQQQTVTMATQQQQAINLPNQQQPTSVQLSQQQTSVQIPQQASIQISQQQNSIQIQQPQTALQIPQQQSSSIQVPQQQQQNSIQIPQQQTSVHFSQPQLVKNTVSAKSNISQDSNQQVIVQPSIELQQTHQSQMQAYVASNSTIQQLTPSSGGFIMQQQKVVNAQNQKSGLVQSSPMLHSGIQQQLNTETPTINSLLSGSLNTSAVVTVTSPPKFTHPVIPPVTTIVDSETSISTLSASVSCDASTAITTSASDPSVPVATTNSKKRPNACAKGSATKRRKPNSAAAMQAEQKQLNIGQTLYTELIDTIKVPSLSALIHQPQIQPYKLVLPPSGCTFETKTHWKTIDEEDDWIDGKCLKYKRSPFSLKYPKPDTSFMESEAEITLSVDELDQAQKNENFFITQHLSTSIPNGPMLHVTVNNKMNSLQEPNAPLSPICTSPVPKTFEDNMGVLMLNKEKHEPQVHESSPKSHILSCLHSADEAGVNGDRSTPPLAMFHLPHPDLLQRLNETNNTVIDSDLASIPSAPTPLEVNPGDTDLTTNTLVSTDPGSTESTVSSTVQLTINGAPQSEPSSQGGGGSGSSPLVDSETGEILGVRRSSTNQLMSDSSVDLATIESNVDLAKDKLHLTFTLNPKSADVQKMVKNITDLLGINYRSVNYQITRNDSSTEIIVDQKNSIMPQKFMELEQQLRDQIAPLSLRLQKENDLPNIEPIAIPTNFSTPTPSGSCNTPNRTCGLSSPLTTPVPLSKHEEQTISFASLKSTKEVCYCRHCENEVASDSGIVRKLSEMRTDRGLSFKTDADNDEIDFCGVICMNQFIQCLVQTDQAFQRAKDDYYSPNYDPSSGSASNHVIEFRQNFFNAPVVLQGPPPRNQKSVFRRQLSHAFDKGRAKKKGENKFMFKRWKGIRWRKYAGTHHTSNKKKLDLSQEEFIEILRKEGAAIRRSDIEDNRKCSLCHFTGDGSEDGAGRLLCLNMDKYLHLNCALWCFDVYETLGGSLNNVEMCYQRALKTMCSYCGYDGAGLPCYNPRCSVVYHVPCAREAGCMFFTDRGMYCQLHQPKEHHMQLKTLAVNRRVYINRDENKQVGHVIHDEEQKHLIRIGSLVLHYVGQLLPHQIEFGTFHNIRHIFPVGFRTTRSYWSYRRPNKRCFYHCSIHDRDGAPEFRVVVQEEGLENEEFSGPSCDGVWKTILERIERLRNENGLIRMFPKHLQGEEMFGLTESHVLRAIESLPGVESLKDYAFKFGRLQLIEEMPLAINPSGCARSEPKMKTYLRRLHYAQAAGSSSHSSRHFLPFAMTGPGGEQTPYSKQYISSRSQQYRRLKMESKNNVILGRSCIQGLGLFAAKDLEKYTMVIEYIGQVIRTELGNRREKEYEAHNRGIYMFRLNDHQIVDATVTGGLARYINHSCQPNCVAEVVSFEKEYHIIIVANKRVEAGEELTYDYKFDFEDASSKLPCMCGAPSCRKWMN